MKILTNAAFFFIYVVWTLGADTHATAQEIPCVNLQNGKVNGKILTSTNGNEFRAFLGIPYGKVTERFTVKIMDPFLHSFSFSLIDTHILDDSLP